MLSDVGDLLEVHDLPVLLDGPAGRRAVNAPLLASIIFASHVDQAFVELVVVYFLRPHICRTRSLPRPNFDTISSRSRSMRRSAAIFLSRRMTR
jgi:hypothetical protein